MNQFQRLVAAGMTEECAKDRVMWYMAQDDEIGLEEYIAKVEKRGDATIHPLQQKSER